MAGHEQHRINQSKKLRHTRKKVYAHYALFNSKQTNKKKKRYKMNNGSSSVNVSITNAIAIRVAKSQPERCLIREEEGGRGRGE